MKWLLTIVVLLVGTSTRAEDSRLPVLGNVVAVEDGDSLWVYVDVAAASYEFSLAGIKAPPLDQPLGRATREALTQMVLGREVTVKVDRLTNDDGEIPVEVLLNGHAINGDIARFVSTATASVGPVTPREIQPRRPLMRLLLSWRDRN